MIDPCRADEWNLNKWAWEGELKVVSKGEECIIKIVDKTTRELYAQAFLCDGEPYHVEAVIDSSRWSCSMLLLDSGSGREQKHMTSKQHYMTT
ncbi:unnamed protein product [Eruca vesicaria subsp. sativa]|uniref:NECAP PHear domain-containing protein n=1 Tax=Eruca vesicaria subsp. sativa TaxID=29727 RepID=A0ABC8INX0_ERUVS|nr:unnamed protein product [Eruca vesicaria subsp. sativa]